MTMKHEPIETLFETSLLITAFDALDATSPNATALLRVDVVEDKKNPPTFAKGAPVVFTVERNVKKAVAIGRVAAFNVDGGFLQYHLLPMCGGSSSRNFTIDSEFGEISFHPQRVVDREERVDLCVLATNDPDFDVTKLDAEDPLGLSNVAKVVVVLLGTHDVGVEHLQMRNDSVAFIGDTLQNVKLPLQRNSKQPTSTFRLANVAFTPASYELGRNVASPEGLLTINERTGDVVPREQFVDGPQGVYTATVEAVDPVSASTASLVSRFHHVKKDKKLRYVLGMSQNEFGANGNRFKQQLTATLKDLQLFFDEPTADVINASMTYVCFYATRDDVVLDEKQTMATLTNNSNVAAELAKLYHVYRVVDIDQCWTPSTTSSAGSRMELARSTFLLLVIVMVLLLVFIALLLYTCIVVRYRRHLERKQIKLKSSAKLMPSPKFIPASFLGSPPPPIAYY